MTGEGSGERNYLCPNGCGRVVLITDARGTKARAIYCRNCRILVTVYLEGYAEARKPPAGGGVVTVGDGDPRNPPIETRRIRDGRRG